MGLKDLGLLLAIIAIIAAVYFIPEMDKRLRRNEYIIIEWLNTSRGKKFLHNGGFALLIWLVILAVGFEWYLDYQGYKYINHLDLVIYTTL